MRTTMNRRLWCILTLAVSLAAPAVVRSQGRTLVIDQREGRPREGQRPVTTAQRDSLEARVRARMAQVLQRQLELTDDQSRRITALSQRLEPRRRALVAEERAVRTALRAQIAAGDSARDAELTSLLNRMIEVQRARVLLLETEQQELTAFLTPLQRAKYLGIEEQMRLRAEQLQGRPMPGQGPPPGMMPGQGPPLGRPRLELRRPPDPE
jgi:protein CpxP